MMVIDAKYSFGDIVYCVTDAEQCLIIVTELKICPTGIIYVCSKNRESASFYDFELSLEPNQELKYK